MLPDEGAKRAFGQMMELFIVPEIERRKQAGTLPVDFQLLAAQILFCPEWDKPIRLNEEAKLLARLKFKSGFTPQVGSVVNAEDIQDIAALRLPDDEEARYGHATILKVGEDWRFTFDFRYNKGLARQYYALAEQFFKVARYAHRNRYVAVFIDNLFSCVELSARAELLLFPDRKFKEKTSHSEVRDKYHWFFGRIDERAPFSALLKELSQMRKNARYLRGNISLNSGRTKEGLKVAAEMLARLQAKLKKH